MKAAEGVTFLLDGKPFTSGELKPDVPGPADRLSLGEHLQFWVHTSGDRLSIRLRDQNNSLRKEFVGLSWFPINPAFASMPATRRTTSRRRSTCRRFSATSIRPRFRASSSFVLNGQEYKLEPFAEPGDEQFWFVFRDLTSQKETYPAARFLYAPAPVNGKMMLDFNRTVNPPCAYNPYSTCPLPSEQNRLRTRIEAGEMRYVKVKSRT